MQTTARWIKLMAWASAWVLGMAALAPWVSHMLAGSQLGAPAGSTIWLTQSICSAQADQNQPNNTPGWQDHCPLCTLPQLGMSPVPEQSLHAPTLPRLSLLPPLFSHAHSPLFAWVAPPSRAPPFLVA